VNAPALIAIAMIKYCSICGGDAELCGCEEEL